MNENSTENQINKLSEQLKLQVGAYEAMAEVYEKYSLALARIMELLHQLHDEVKDTDQNVELHFAEIITCVTVVGESIKHAEEAIRMDNSAFSQRFNELVVSMNKILDKIDNADNDIVELRSATQELYALITHNSETTLSMIRDIHQYNQQKIDFWKKWSVWLYTVLGLIGVIECLIQFGVIHLTWFK